MNRACAPGWGREHFLPAPGCFPPATEPRRDERVLACYILVPGDPQAALGHALAGLTRDGGQFEMIDWYADRAAAPMRLLDAAQRITPTLVFLQIQGPGVLTSTHLAELRTLCHHSAVIVQWDGDHRHDHTDGPDRDWFRELARGCDINAVTCTRDVLEYAEQGVRGASYLQIGCDTDLWRPTDPAPEVPEIVMLANYYPSMHRERIETCKRLTDEFPGKFSVYGRGWHHRPDIASGRFLEQHEEAAVYSAASAAVSMSIRNDLPRYTSDRLFRCLASGALTLVEEFPDMEGLGLEDSVNCRVFEDWYDLERIVSIWLSRAASCWWSTDIRAGARELALSHSWTARMRELSAMVETIRSQRAA